MVSYQAYVRIAFDVAESKGAEFDGIEDGGSFLRDLGQYWQENKSDLKPLTEQQTRNVLNRVVSS